MTFEMILIETLHFQQFPYGPRWKCCSHNTLCSEQMSLPEASDLWTLCFASWLLVWELILFTFDLPCSILISISHNHSFMKSCHTIWSPALRSTIITLNNNYMQLYAWKHTDSRVQSSVCGFSFIVALKIFHVDYYHGPPTHQTYWGWHSKTNSGKETGV